MTDDRQDPEWLKEALQELERLQPPHVDRKRRTVIELVDARIHQRSEESVWKLPGTCSRTTYHRPKNGWKHDPLFVEVLENTLTIARSWRDSRTLRATKRAADNLQLSSPLAVQKLLELLTASEDENVIFRAATAILDRANVSTAVKQDRGVELILKELDVSALTDEQLTRLLDGENPLKVLFNAGAGDNIGS